MIKSHRRRGRRKTQYTDVDKVSTDSYMSSGKIYENSIIK